VVTLDEWFTIGKQQDGEQLAKTVNNIMKEHGGLAWSLGRKYGKKLEKYESISYMWESLPTAIAEWDIAKGKASTALTLVFCRLMSRFNEKNIKAGSVRIPPKRQSDYLGQRLSYMTDKSELECVLATGREYGELYGESRTTY